LDPRHDNLQAGLVAAGVTLHRPQIYGFGDRHGLRAP